MTHDPSTELLEHVDQDDNSIGPITREFAHRTGAPHRAVHVVVWNCHGRILLQKRAASKESYPGSWDTSVGGHVGAEHHAAGDGRHSRRHERDERLSDGL